VSSAGWQCHGSGANRHRCSGEPDQGRHGERLGKNSHGLWLRVG
jgi:hypothetical protein